MGGSRGGGPPWKYQRRHVAIKVVTRTAAKTTSITDITSTTESMKRFMLGKEGRKRRGEQRRCSHKRGSWKRSDWISLPRTLSQPHRQSPLHFLSIGAHRRTLLPPREEESDTGGRLPTGAAINVQSTGRRGQSRQEKLSERPGTCQVSYNTHTPALHSPL